MLYYIMTEDTIHTVVELDSDLVADDFVLSTISSSAFLESRSSFIHTHNMMNNYM